MEKDFNINPNSFFIGGQGQEQTHTNEWKDIAEAKEKRSKRATFSLTPSLYKRLREFSVERGISTNELVNRLLDTYLQTEGK